MVGLKNLLCYCDNTENPLPKQILEVGEYMYSIASISHEVRWIISVLEEGGNEEQNGWHSAVKQQIKTQWDPGSHYSAPGGKLLSDIQFTGADTYFISVWH